MIKQRTYVILILQIEFKECFVIIYLLLHNRFEFIKLLAFLVHVDIIDIKGIVRRQR